MGRVRAPVGDGALGPDPSAAPDLGLAIAGPHEDGESRLVVAVFARGQNHDRARFLEAAQVVHVRVRAKTELRVVGAGRQLASVEHQGRVLHM